MKTNPRRTKLEEALLKIHLDVSGDKGKSLDSAVNTIRQLTSFVIGQHEIEDNEVSLVVQVLVKERNKLRKEQHKRADDVLGKDEMANLTR